MCIYLYISLQSPAPHVTLNRIKQQLTDDGWNIYGLAGIVIPYMDNTDNAQIVIAQGLSGIGKCWTS